MILMNKTYELYDDIKNVLVNTKYTLNDYKTLLSRLNDEKSKYAAYYKVMYDNTNDSKYIFKLVKTMYYGSNFNSNEDRLMFILMINIIIIYKTS